MPHADPVAYANYQREYKRANRWRFRPRQKAYDAAKHANQRAASLGAVGTITLEQAQAVLAVGVCHHCGATGEMTIDHLVPMARGGLNEPANLVPSCDACNKSKMNAPTPWRWARAHDCCLVCGTTDRPHLTHGRCAKCARRERAARDRSRRKAAI